MLTYLINVTGDMLAVSLVIGVIFAFMDTFCGEHGRRVIRAGLAAGIVISAVRSYITNTRRLAGGWRVGAWGYAAVLILFVILLICFAVFGRKFFARKEDDRTRTVPEMVLSGVTALLMAGYMYGALPNVYVYPFKFDTGGNGILSTDYLFRLGGYLLGIAVSVTAAIAAYKICQTAAVKGYRKAVVISFWFMNILYTVFSFARLMLVLTPRKIVKSIAMFNFAAFSNNHSHWYTWAGFAMLSALGIWLWVKSSTAKEAYATNAQHRRQRAQWRTGKRYSGVLLACFLVGILTPTWFVKLNTVVIREAPVEEPVLANGADGVPEELRVPLEMVSDGHLHRFGYTTDEGYPTRFIVVLKQENTNNYGIGLDACEICGEAGYYENNDGQIVCKKCGVVMNTTTIGMKGGCNPIIIDYDINESYITVPVSEMVKNESRFKK